MRYALAAAFVLAISGTAAIAGGVSVPLDEVRTVTFTKPVTTVFVGNPTIADINMIDSRHAFLLGKSFGMTNIIALDALGHQVSNVPVAVTGSRAATVTLTKGTAQMTLACNSGRCEAAPQPGDANFSGVMGDIVKHLDMGAKSGQ
ncbi:MAG: pilus assembly protein N-terminal domain-containing protein [Proteobacteria bacterium]|nr:pilus assembly protein N-terminal domain-containing protein [Pseudomonadota bacterium]